MSHECMNAKECAAYDGWMIWLDQYGNKWWAKSIAQVKDKMGVKLTSPVVAMFCDMVAGPHAGQTMQTGVILKSKVTAWFQFDSNGDLCDYKLYGRNGHELRNTEDYDGPALVALANDAQHKVHPEHANERQPR